MRTNSLLVQALFFGMIFFVVGVVRAQHLADAEFDASVSKPAYSKNGPRVLFDEAHYNYHTLTDRYKPFADLLTNDGYRLIRNRQLFTKKVLESFKVLVVVNALAEDIDEPGADKPALTDEEIAVVHDWVRGGGSLLLVADAGPFANSASRLAGKLGVEMSGNFVRDPANAESSGRTDVIVYSRENHQLLSHPITQGRNAEETLKRIMTFTGQSLKGPEGSVPFLKLAETAIELSERSTAPDGAARQNSQSPRAQGIAFKMGGGRVVMLSEAEMLSALLGDPPEKEPIGMNYPGIDNKQLTLNIMHWLSGLLSER